MDNSSLPFVLHRLVHKMDRSADYLLQRKFGISYSRGHFLLTLSWLSPVSQSDLAKNLGYRPASISEMVQELAGIGYLMVSIDPQNRKRNIVRLTNKGRNFVSEATDYLDTQFSGLLSKAKINEKKLLKTVRKIDAALDSHGNKI